MAALDSSHDAVGSLECTLASLVIRRQELRSRAASAAELETNRQAIVAIQWQLGRAFGEQHRGALRPAAG
ncbi:MAG: hypothetical protein ACJ74L_04090 [Gaiellaceae bacterium]|jgi:hypothetical protein